MRNHNGLEISYPNLIGSSKESWTMHSICDPARLCGGKLEEIFVNICFFLNIMNVKKEKVPAKFVPAAAVTRMGRVLFILTRRKGLLGG